MKPEETALFSDLDGTLFDSAGRVSPENRAAVERYIAAGGAFALSTGRMPKNLLRMIGDLPTNVPSVVMNGAAVCDLRVGRMERCAFLDRTALDPALRRALRECPGMDLQVYTAEDIVYCTPEETANRRYLELHQPAVFRDFDAMEGEPLLKCLLFPRPADYEGLGVWLRTYAEGRFELVPGSIVLDELFRYYEIMPLGVDKGTALRGLRSHPALEGRTILAVGDYWNDYALLREADVPVCPSNAIDEIRALCRFVTVSHDESAIAHVIGEIIPGL